MVGVKGCASLPTGIQAILDTRRGILLTEPTPDVGCFYQREAERLAAAELAASTWRDLPAISAEGDALPLYANVASVVDVRAAIERGAEGIGLFRTELLISNLQSPISPLLCTLIASTPLATCVDGRRGDVFWLPFAPGRGSKPLLTR
jgi:phosphoenolpyruvate-protein kinase (PTS system EI component)